jgi:hypothetical protein
LIGLVGPVLASQGRYTRGMVLQMVRSALAGLVVTPGRE